MDTADQLNKKGAAQRYEKLALVRESFLKTARECAALTLPSLLRPEGSQQGDRLTDSYQSTGARGSAHLASKLLLALFPPNKPFYRHRVSDVDLDEQAKQDKEFKTELDEALSKREQIIQDALETSNIRSKFFTANKHLIVTGNQLVNFIKGGGVRAFPLDQYVVKRDSLGKLIEIILKESVTMEQLPEKVQSEIHQNKRANEDCSGDKELDLYTWMKLTDKKWEVHQEVRDLVIEEGKGSYKEEIFPWQALRWNHQDGEDYGRGYIEGLYGDLKSLSGLSQALVQGAAAAAKVVFLVDPNSSTSVKRLSECPNGGFVAGREEDVSPLRVDKQGDFRVAFDKAESIKSDLEKSFLLNSSVQRKGERVTATEWRYMVEELESTLGGVYAIQSQDLQLWLARLISHDLEERKVLRKLPDTVRLQIVTGLDALGRSSDANKLSEFISEASQVLGPETVQKYINPSEVLRRQATSQQIDTKNLVYTEDEVAQAAQAQQQAQGIQQVAPQLAKSVGDLANTNLKAQVAPAA